LAKHLYLTHRPVVDEIGRVQVPDWGHWTSVIFARECRHATLYFTGSAQMALKNNFNDRRRRKRQLLNTSVQIFATSSHVNALGINLSDVGMCLFSMVNLPLGSQIEVEFLPPRCTERVRKSGTVRHRAVFLYGIEFLADADQGPQGWTDTPIPSR
jgi:hypothetical protein